MPTGYTAGILDGTIQDFEGFAKTCMRAFGATIHMKEESLDKPYEPRVPSTYHLERMESLEGEISLAESKTPEEYVEEERELIKEELLRIQKQIEERKKKRQKLESILQNAQVWNPPTEDHTSFKEFMIEQLESTIQFDVDVEYYEDKLKEIEIRMGENLDGVKIKERNLDALMDSLHYHTKNYEEELERCRKSNKWVEDLIQSI